MNNTLKIGYAEAIGLTLIVTGPKAFLGYPRLMTELGYTAGWLITIIGGALAIVFWLIIAKLLKLFPGKSIILINESVLGPVFGTAINLLLLFYILVVSSILLRQFTEVIILSALPEAPISSLTFLFIIPAFIAVFLGLEAISRSTYISLPFILVGVLAVLVSLYPEWDIKQLLPVFGSGLGQVLKYGFLTVTTYGEVIIIALLVPYFSFGADKVRSVGIQSLLITVVVFMMIVIVFTMVFPLPGANEVIAPFYQLSRAISVGRYFQRVEAVFILFWTLTAFLQISVSILITLLVFKDTFKLPFYKPLLPAISMLIFSISLTPRDLMQTIVFEGQYRSLYGGIITFGIPLFVYAIAVLKGKGVKRDDAQKEN